MRRDLLAADALGARHIKVAPDVTDGPWERDLWVAEFAALATEATDAGTRIGLEFLPWSNIKTVHDGLGLVRAAGHPGGGLVIDVGIPSAHTPPADLAEVPLQQIVGVELNDADAEPIGTLFEDTVRRRRLCGEGTFDLPASSPPCALPDGTARGASRSCPTSTGRLRSVKRSRTLFVRLARSCSDSLQPDRQSIKAAGRR